MIPLTDYLLSGGSFLDFLRSWLYVMNAWMQVASTCFVQKSGDNYTFSTTDADPQMYRLQGRPWTHTGIVTTRYFATYAFPVVFQAGHAIGCRCRLLCLTPTPHPLANLSWPP